MLTNRYQHFFVENTCSTKYLFFLEHHRDRFLNLSDFNIHPDTVKHSNVQLFAMTVFFINSIDDAHKLQSHLDSLCLWTEMWLMRFNVSKCHVMHITQAKLHITDSIYSLGEVSLANTWVLQLKVDS